MDHRKHGKRFEETRARDKTRDLRRPDIDSLIYDTRIGPSRAASGFSAWINGAKQRWVSPGSRNDALKPYGLDILGLSFPVRGSTQSKWQEAKNQQADQNGSGHSDSILRLGHPALCCKRKVYDTVAFDLRWDDYDYQGSADSWSGES